ncbi:MAG: DNA translocase FtsK [Opitutae bacterium]|nr:DNA translocase FtsK [Opitutae bacterium]MDG2344702.1 DNA translocase FtsK [Opitutae bacterium]
MARKPKKKVARKKVVSQPRKAGSRPAWALLLFTTAVLLLVAIFDYNSGQYHADPPTDTNLVGHLGSFLGFYGFHYLGASIFLLPVYLMWIGVRFLIQQQPRKRAMTSAAAFASLICAAGLIAMLGADSSGGLFQDQLSHGCGGVLGELIAPILLEPYVGLFGSYFILLMGFTVGSMIVFTDNLGRCVDYVQSIYSGFFERLTASKEARKALRAERAERKRIAKEEAAAAKAQAKADRSAAKASKQLERSTADEDEFDQGQEDDRRPSLLPASMSSPAGLTRKAVKKKPAISKQAEPVAEVPDVLSEPVEDVEPAKPKFDPSMIKVVSEQKTEKAVGSIPERRGDYVFPPLNLLAEPQGIGSMHQEDHAGTMGALVRTLDEFGVKVIPGEIHTGPVITRYEVKPAPGVRVEKIVNLDKNIALGLQAMSVRILAPVPGKGTVGIEVPNKVAEAVCMRDIVESKAWADANAEIPVVLGKDVTGKPMVMDLTKMPHVLIAGSTGSGKTVCINAIIASLLYHSGPEDLRFIMVDPKVVEMQMYNALPHMLIPVVTEAKKVPGALKWLIAEMEHRYQIFAKTNVRNIAGFNAKLLKDKEEQAKAEAMDADMTPEERAAVTNMEVPRDDDAFEIPKKKLPYIVCIIDELADLMMVAPADIETCIARIAQLARAAGIHLVLATQRPSVNVVTGVIKANLPSRISFKVASKIDSRTILDGGGAEALIGKGDMLFIPPGTSNLVRAQGAFVSDDEINAIVEFLQEKNDPPVFAEAVQQQIDAGGEEGGGIDGGEEADELLPDAIDVLRSTKRASTSMLQRRLRVGYNRAARLMEVLEDRGIVGPENGSSPREILVDLDVM